MRKYIITACLGLTLGSAFLTAPAEASETKNPWVAYIRCQLNVGKNGLTVAKKINHDPHRILYPDSAATMDYNPRRLNYHLSDRITHTLKSCDLG